VRGPDIEIKKPQGVYRILTLGDSFTMGKGVEDNETFSAVLETIMGERLRQCRKQRKKVSVINCGVDSYSPILSYIQLSRELILLEPDLVVLNLDMSDLVQEIAYRQQAIYDKDGNIVGVPGGNPTDTLSARFRYWIENHLFITRVALFYTNKLLGHKDLTIRGVVERANEEVIKHTLADDPTDRSAQWQLIFDSINRIHHFCRDRNIKFLLTVYPWAHQISNTEAIPARYTYMAKDAIPSNASLNTITELSQEYDIKLVNLFPIFQSYLGSEPLYFKHDMHWTTTGHTVMASGLAQYLFLNYQHKLCEK
jgi:hypothetical protein